MDGDRAPLFCDEALAGRVERAEAQLMARVSEAARTDAAGFAIAIAGGVASFAGEDSPFNKVAGLGFAGLPGAVALEDVERAFSAHGASVHLGDEQAVQAISTRLGADPVAPANAFWREHGTTFEDPDGFQVVLVPERWEL